MGTTSAEVSRWRRYGKDRLYVSQADGTKVGYWDLVTDEPHPATPEHLAVLLAAVDEWKAAGGSVAGRPEVESPTDDVVTTRSAPAHDPEPAPESPTAEDAVPPAWVDLAGNRAGAEARERAIAAREAAPVKTLLARALRVHTDERAWRIGADGEEKVADQFAKVVKKDSRWRFIHAIPVGARGADIDHLVIGPGGVFSVNTKHHPKARIWVGGNTFKVNGVHQPYLRNSRHEAIRAARLLTAACGVPVHVEAVIVTVNAESVTVKNTPEGLHVVPRLQVSRWLRQRADVLSDDAIEAIHDAARRSTTWSG